ncbi:alpha/beta fold hydrolase [Undibacterium sp. TJN25]|uniref:alpha/beta fold hydrolase n=1 Tax=Undibacterium sp. TJN25 TaxID=3413056 RepID=UPI003BEFC06F
MNNNGTRIYYEEHGAGEPLVLMHGFTSSGRQWQMTGFVDGLKDAYRLILIDARGHGQSDKPHDAAAYALEQRLTDINTVLDSLDIVRSHFLAYSMGGWQAFGMALHYPQRVASLAIGGAHPYADSLQAFDGTDGEDLDAFVMAMENFIGEKISREARPFVLQNDIHALLAAANDREGYAARLADVKAPLMLFVGDRDRRLALVQRTAEELQAKKLLLVPGTNHSSTLFASATILPVLKDFLQAQCQAL